MNEMKNRAAEFVRDIQARSFHELCQFVCDELRKTDQRHDWVGIYWVEGEDLVLKAWAGDQNTEHTRIPISTGICGAAVREAQTIIVDDVNKDPRYLACFVNTHSEIVVPIWANGIVVGEIDIDGLDVGAYNDHDREFLEALAEYIAAQLKSTW